MKFCVKERIQEATQVIAKPVVKSQMSLTAGIYKDKSSAQPEMEFNYSGSPEMKLVTAIAITAGVIVALGAWRSLRRMF